MTRTFYRRAAFAASLTVWLLGPAPLSAQSFTPIRVNAGGSAFTDGASNVWSADTGYNTGSTASTGGAISGTTDDTLYQTNRWDGAGGSELEYSFTVPNGFYEVSLLFAETWSGAFSVGARVFDVEMEGSVVLPSVDVYAESGANAALVRTAMTAVADGTLNVRFLHLVENPFVSAIEIKATTKPSQPSNILISPVSTTQHNLSWTASIDDVAVARYEIERCQGASCTTFALIAGPTTTSYQDSALTASTTYRYRLRAVDSSGQYSDYSTVKSATTMGTSGPGATRINTGGSSFTDSSSNVWSADTGYNTGSTFTSGNAIAGTTDDSLYQSERWDAAGSPELEYTISAPAGRYEVRLHFAETSSSQSAVGRRVFSVQLEGATALSNVDVFAEAGANTALVKSATTSVADGTLNIRFIHGVENPFIHGLEVLWSPPSDGSAPSAPTNLSDLPASSTAVTLSWSASTDDVAVTGYAIERCVGTGCVNFAEIATASSLSYQDTGLVTDSTYRYRVRAYDAAGNRSAYSNTDTAVTRVAVSYVYDELGRLALVVLPSGASITYAYDESGNVTAIVRAAP